MEGLLLVIIIGVLTAIFGKGKGNRQRGNHKPFSVKTFDEFRTLVQTETTNLINKIDPAKEQKDIEEKYHQIKQETVKQDANWVSPDRAMQNQQKRIKEQKPEQAEVEEPLFSKDPDAQTLINGIIWSEILGEPRSKKPYSPRRT